MNAMLKRVVDGPRTAARTIVASDGKVLTGSYVNKKQAQHAARIIERRREALAYLAKR
ncbi:hypothetical protein U4I37_04665 [Stenotrophomonas maltophilia]|uniref:hypothetical protein n=1 Tax=Stenotrophomonas TaxID=40323 RepID=UPI00131200E3|nr:MULTISPECIES: hypothetical protein [Stenotrophomonas]MCU1024084.1 hypothetical protein [Stenotrophomonas maltophilia]MCU1208668.1 hypothetical protein [Stenotrophomonas maltophilia]MDQ7308896.1 hypothetical protein [Stenotrophomonas sp. Sm3119]MDZ5785527.1 hypothetical protein [Stenotrophomonas maltophilia]HDS1554868.1 hypothetical protein [Stenotrophomonas maltophilia]